MKLSELVANIRTLPEKERADNLRRLMPHLTPLTHGSMQRFQNEFTLKHPEKPPYEVFRKEQDTEWLSCLEMEMSDIGAGVREVYGLPPLKPDLEI